MSLNINDAELGKFMELGGETGVKVFLLHGDNWLPSVANLAALPWSGNTLGDIRQTTDDGNLYRWNGTVWEIYDSNTWNVLTSPTTADTAVSSKWGLPKTVDSATWWVAITATWWVEGNASLGLYGIITAGASISIDNTVTREWRKTLKLSTTNATGKALVVLLPEWKISPITGTYENGIKLKPLTKYKFTIWMNTKNVLWSYINFVRERNSSWWIVWTNTLSTSVVWDSNGWVKQTIIKTTASGTTYSSIFLQWADIAWNIWDTWFDYQTATLEEIVEPVADDLTSSSPSIVSLKAVGSVDNIDQSQLDSTTAHAIWSLASWTSRAYRFTPTKLKSTSISVYLAKVGSPIDNTVIEIQTTSAWLPTWIVVASYSMVSSWISWTKTLYTFNTPSNLTIWQDYAIVSKRSWAIDLSNYVNIYWTATDNASWRGYIYDWASWASWARQLYFTEQYYKPTTSFTARQNNVLVNIPADEDGFLDGSVIDIVNGTYSFTKDFRANLPLYSGLVHSYSDTTLYGSNFATNWMILPSWRNIVYKVNTWVKITWLTKIKFFSTWLDVWEVQTIQVSTDNLYYTDIFTISWGWGTQTVSWTTSILIWNSSFFIRVIWSGWGITYIWMLTIETNIDTSSISTLYNYPTNKDIIQTYTKTLSSPTTIALYRETKYDFPAIEYSNGEYQFLEIDPTATGSTVAFSSNGSSYTTVTDGASIGLTSTVNPVVWVRSNITANRIYVSSNDYNADSKKDGSIQMDIVYQVKNQGLIYDVQDLQKEVNKLKTGFIPWMTITNGEITTEVESYLIVPTATGNINLLKVPKAGTRFSIIVRTSWTSSYTLTFNTGFKSTWTLATGTVDAKYFTVNFISDGIQAIETSRTTAM